MSAEDLCRLRILVTRPAGQCEALCRRIAELGGEGIPWPAIEIEPLRPDAGSREQLARAGDEDLVIFVSRNAVVHGATLLPRSPRPRLAAIGPSTRNALEQIGLDLDIEPDGFDSESLLTHRQLTKLEGHRVFIVRGAGGRELLGDTLRERGATVDYVEVYRRRPRTSTPRERAELLATWQSGGVDLYTATSVQILEALYSNLGDEFSEMLASTPLVTASRRVVQRSEELRHRAERVLAPGPDDRSLVAAIASWRGRPRDPAGRPELGK
jgi:uroporphyrinogen-III synthase